MLNFITKILGGTKSERDIKKLQPYVDTINTEFEKLKSFSNDELRAKTTELKKEIAEHVSDEYAEVQELKKKIQEN
ncbi:MAG: hypothetical protein R6U19_03430, partial [Bacteroidales bacterium]